jgi:hypothetical protein
VILRACSTYDDADPPPSSSDAVADELDPPPQPAAPTASTGAQKHHSASPFSASGTPIAAASATAGSATSTDSTSAGPSRLPAMLMASSERPSRNHWPSSSTRAQSPWRHTPG